MTGFEWLLAPIAIGVVLLLLKASRIPPLHWVERGLGGEVIALLALAVSYYLSKSYFEQLALVSSFVIVLIASLRRDLNREFKILILISTLGALTCINSDNWMNLFVGIELLTLPIYGLIAWDKVNSKNVQAAIKYLVLAGSSSAFLLLGMAFLYADSGSMALQLDSLKGSVLLFVGIGFKLSLVPFHLWTGDIYEDSPLAVTAFLATVSKIALIGALVNLTPSKQITGVLSIVAILSMMTGSLLTLRQQNIARFLGYSSIAHMGYILVAWLTGADVGLYMAAYTVTLLVAFWMLSWKPEHSVGSAILALSFLSLMGLPMLPIFWGKYQILITAFASQHWTLFGFFIFSSLLGVYGYARLITKIGFSRSAQA